MSPAEKTSVLIEALPYLQRFRGATIVIKYGGSAMEDAQLIDLVLRDLVLIEVVGINPVVVHGGGKAITQRMNQASIVAQFVNGLRVTDAASIKIVQEVLDQETNPTIVSGLKEHGGKAIGVSGRKVFKARKALPLKLADGNKADLGFVGEIVGVDTKLLRHAIRRTEIPVVSPLGESKDGTVFNINADIAAMELAIALKALKLIYLSDVPGILRDPHDPSSVISTISYGEIQQLKDKGILKGGMLPKVESAIQALTKGVGKVQFIDGRARHSLLLELFTDAGCGTEIIPD